MKDRTHLIVRPFFSFALGGVLVLACLSINATPTDAQQPQLVVQTGHSGAIESLAFSPDGRTLASGDLDNTIKLWDVKSGAEIRTLKGHVGLIRSVAFSPDSKTLASGDTSNIIKLWNVETGAEIRTLRDHFGWYNTVVFSPDGKTLASVSVNKTIKLWNVKSGAEINTLKFHSSNINTVALSPKGKLVAGASDDRTIKLWNMKSGVLMKSLEGHTDAVGSLAFSPDGKTLVSAGANEDKTIKLWNVESGMEIKTLKGHLQWASSVAFSPDGQTLASGSMGTIKLWDIKKGVEIRTIEGLISVAAPFAFSPDGTLLASGGVERKIKIWNMATGVQIRSLEGRTDSVGPIAFSPDSKVLASVSGYFGAIKLWNVQGRMQVRTYENDLARVESVAFAPDGKTLMGLVMDVDSKIKFWDVESDAEINTLLKGQTGVKSVTYSPNGKTLASGGFDTEIRIWDIATGAKINTLKGHSQKVNSIVFSPDGTILASADDDGIVKLWKATSGTEITTVFGDSNRVNSIAFSPDGRTLAIGGFGVIRLWDILSGTEIKRIEGQIYSVGSVAFSPDGKTLASTTVQEIKLWDVKSGAEIGSLHGHSGWGISFAYAPDGTTMASGSSDSTIRIWDAKSHKELAMLIALDDNHWVVTTPDGRFDTNQNLDKIGGLIWVLPDQPLTPKPLEIFMRDYYEPRLLRRVLKSQTLPKVPSLSDLNPLQPTIEKIGVTPHSNNQSVVDVRVKVASVAGECLRNGKHRQCESGVYDLRLYRNGQLVKQSPISDGTPNNLGGPNWRQQLQEWRQASRVKSENDKPITVSSGPQEIRFTNIQLPNVSQVEFTAYAFNEDRVKSATSEPVVHPLPQPRPGIQPKAYVLTVGVDFSSALWRLGFARKGVEEIEALLQKNLKSQYEVVPVQLLSAKNSRELVNLATRKNIQTVLNILSGRDVAQADRAKIPHQEQLQKATPDDLVVLYIASHGYVDPIGKFYVIPSDVGPPLGVSEESLDRCLKNSEQSTNCENGRRLLQRSISSDELTQWIEAIDAGQMALILDSCHSGAVTGPNFKPGPMGDRSFGQLSYDKGMLVLTATQAQQLETGTLELGNRSVLTYALTQRSSGPISDLRKWLSDAEKEVPKLYQQFVKSDSADTRINESDQEPSLFDFSKRQPKPIQ